MATLTIDPTEVRPLEGCLTQKAIMGADSQHGRMVRVSDEAAVNKPEVTETDADAAATVAGAVGMIVSGAANIDRKTGVVKEGEEVTLVLWGRVWVDCELDLTKSYFLANTTNDVNGLLGDVAGTVTRLVARPLATHVLFIDGVSTVQPTS